jgi:membrane protease YdiL (CAAX protease family)
MIAKVRHDAIASGRHTAILCLILLAVAAAGLLALHSARPGAAAATSSTLLPGLIIAEVALLYYVWIGVRRGGLGLRDLAFQGRMTALRGLTDVAAGIALFLFLTLVSALIARWFGPGDTSVVNSVVGAAATQPALWVIVSLVAAVSEELTYRGYLQLQLAAWLRNPLAAIVAQAALFGVTHGYQGGFLMFKIAVLGIVFGLVAWARNSRIAGVIAHFGLDVSGGLGLFSW